MENGEDTLGAFLNIEGAFDSTSFDIITNEAKRHGHGATMCQWTGSILSGRKITAVFAAENLEGSVARGCVQWGILLPLLWSLDVDKFIGGLNNENGCYRLGYADDIAILISGKFLHTISGLFQETLNTVQQWCDGTSVSIIP